MILNILSGTTSLAAMSHSRSDLVILSVCGIRLRNSAAIILACRFIKSVEKLYFWLTSFFKILKYLESAEKYTKKVQYDIFIIIIKNLLGTQRCGHYRQTITSETLSSDLVVSYCYLTENNGLSEMHPQEFRQKIMPCLSKPIFT